MVPAGAEHKYFLSCTTLNIPSNLSLLLSFSSSFPISVLLSPSLFSFLISTSTPRFELSVTERHNDTTVILNKSICKFIIWKPESYCKFAGIRQDGEEWSFPSSGSWQNRKVMWDFIGRIILVMVIFMDNSRTWSCAISTV